MPVMDGFQTFRALEQAGSRAPAVFLSMVDDDEHVNKAFRCGARGYVLKSRIMRDLPSALNHALLGRTFAPSLSALSRLAADGGHAMQLHGDAKSFLEGLAGLFDLVLRRGDATCVIAPADVREGLAARLQGRGWDVGAGRGLDRYLVFDAADALHRFMRNGLPDPARLAEIVTELDHYRTTTGGTSSRLTIFGNMSMLLSADGNTEAAMALESLWDGLTRDLPFLTLCGYLHVLFPPRAAPLVPACVRRTLGDESHERPGILLTGCRRLRRGRPRPNGPDRAAPGRVSWCRAENEARSTVVRPRASNVLSCSRGPGLSP